MDLSNAMAAGHQQRNNSSVRCFRCGYTGNFARECTAAVHKTGDRRGDSIGHSLITLTFIGPGRTPFFPTRHPRMGISLAPKIHFFRFA
ncbi:hypothetical protein PC123_g19449 [Phytophthora cactorum]|nr:hypothetical protein PC123_g19449 [Phytophthora cactorum]